MTIAYERGMAEAYRLTMSARRERERGEAAARRREEAAAAEARAQARIADVRQGTLRRLNLVKA